MRISTNTFIEGSVGRMTDLQSKISKVQQQISSGKRLTDPSDDPIAAAEVVNVNNSIAINEQYSKNRIQLTNNLNQVDAVLSNITDVLQNINEVVIKASSGLNSQDDKFVLSSTLQSEFDQLLKLANSSDSFGNYIFSGSNNSEASFKQDADGVWFYSGSKINRVVNVDHTITMASSISGFDLFGLPEIPGVQNNIFNELSDSIKALKNSGTVSDTDLNNVISKLSSSYRDTLTQVNQVQSEVGNRLNMIDRFDSLGSSRSLQLTQTLSNLQDLDYTKAISEFTRQQTVLQAAQQTYAQASKLSLFDYIK